MPALSPCVVPINVASLVLQALDDTETLTLVLMQAPESRLGLSIMATNGAFERAFGYQPGACVGWGLDIITGVESEPATIARIRAAAHSGTRAEGEFLAITRNGGSLWFGFHLMPVTEARGQFVLIGRDITQKYVAERAERSVNQLLAAVFARVDVPVLICDDRDQLRMVNPAFVHHFGHRAENLLGRDLATVVPPLVPGVAQKLGDTLRANGETTSSVRDAVLADGTKSRCRMSSSLLQVADGQRFVIITLHPGAGSQPNHPTALVAGRLCLIGLETVRAALGPRWPGMAERAMEAAEAVLKRRLEPSEVFSRTDDYGFVVRFTGHSEQEHGFRAAIIAREIEAKLIGHGPDPAAATVSALAETLTPTSSHIEGETSVLNALNNRLKSRADSVEKQARQVLVTAATEGNCLLNPVAGWAGGPKPTNLAIAEIPVEKRREIAGALAVLPQAAQDEFDLDLLLMTQAVDRTSQAISRATTHVTLIPVSYENFGVRRRADRYFEQCRALDNVVRHHVMFLLGPLPADYATSRALEIIGMLRQFSKGVALRVDTLEPPRLDLPQNAIQLVTMEADEVLAQAPARLAKFLQSLVIRKARLLATDASDAAGIEKLTKAGVGLLTMRQGDQTAMAAD